MQRRSILKTLALAATGSAGAAFGQAAARPVRIITSLQAGSAIDYQARVLAPFLGAALDQPVVVENKPGGRDVIAITELMKSPPDGNTLYMGSLSPLALNVALVKNLPYDPRRDVTPIAGVAIANHVLVVKSSFPARNLTEFIAHAKQNPGKISIGHATTFVLMQIASLNKLAGIELLPVPYKGTPATITDVLGESLNATLLDTGNALPHIRSGAMRALGVTTLRRNPLTPEIPAIAETLPGFDFAAWTALVGPPGMRRETVNRIHAAMDSALKQKELVDKYTQTATNPYFLTPDQFKALIESDTAKWLRLAREANIQPE